MNNLTKICHDYKHDDGCTMIANPQNTMIAAEYGYPDAEDLHFCDHCKTEREQICDEVMQGIVEGCYTVEQVHNFINEIEAKN